MATTTLDDSSEPPVDDAAPKWGVRRTVGYGLLVGIAFVLVQVAVLFVMLIERIVNEPSVELQDWLGQVDSDGMYVSLATIGSGLLCAPLVVRLAGRREPDAWGFLRLTPTDGRSVATWSLAVVGLAVVADLITISLGRPVVPDASAELFSGGPSLLLFIALVFAAPLFEEIFFRGLLIGALEKSGASGVVAALASSLAWAGIHLQYDLYGIAWIFVTGLLFAAARAKTGSLIPCLVMHGVSNAIAFAEAAWNYRGAIG
jgi:membrane protease YdiL (CAAX protease family)